eukprot:7073256-Prymnesium_polylepis.1
MADDCTMRQNRRGYSLPRGGCNCSHSIRCSSCGVFTAVAEIVASSGEAQYDTLTHRGPADGQSGGRDERELRPFVRRHQIALECDCRAYRSLALACLAINLIRHVHWRLHDAAAAREDVGEVVGEGLLGARATRRQSQLQ